MSFLLKQGHVPKDISWLNAGVKPLTVVSSRTLYHVYNLNN